MHHRLLATPKGIPAKISPGPLEPVDRLGEELPWGSSTPAAVWLQSEPSSARLRNDATSSRSTVRRMGGSVESSTPR
jgi:hypothetical protein